MAYRVFFVVLSLSLLACTGGRRGGGVPPADTGTADTATTDSGTTDTGIVLMDTGTRPDTSTPPECDSTRPCPVGQTCVSGMCQTDTTPECDSMRPCPSGQVCSSGTCVPDSTRICDGSDIPYNRVAVCSSTTATCVDACADGACIQTCLDGDANPDCSTCVNQNVLSCINDAGCQASWDPYVCCVEDNCGAMATSSCIMSVQTGACSRTYTTWDTCSDTADIDTVCPSGEWLTDCF